MICAFFDESMVPNVNVVMDTHSSIVSSHICTQDLLGMFPSGLWLSSF